MAALRSGAYSGGSRMAADWPGPDGRDEDDDQAEEATAASSDEDDDEDQGDVEDQADEDGADEAPASGGRGSGLAQDGAGWVLGLLLWGWVLLPFIKGGPAQVGAVWRAKFLNRAPDGSELP